MTPSTIKACFQNCGFVFPDKVLSNIEDPVEAELQVLVSELGEEEVIFEDDLECFETVNESNVVKYLVSEHKDSINDREADADEKNTVSEVVEISKPISSHEAIQSLKNAIQYSEENDMVKEAGIDLCLLQKAKEKSTSKQMQKNITDFFK